MTTLKTLVEGVEDNNTINNGNWSDWTGADAIFETYCDDEYCDEYCDEPTAIEILENAIQTNGKSLNQDLIQLRNEIWGNAIVIPDTFWDGRA